MSAPCGATGRFISSMYDRIPRVIRGKEVLELATGPGLLAKHVAHAAKRMVATDYAEGMIREAQKGPCPENLTFEVADATALFPKVLWRGFVYQFSGL